jgi:anti-sigma factor RsiW
VLTAFIAGELEEVRAVAVAEHLDSCARCRQLCLAEDELHALLQASELGMEPPEDLVSSILETAATTPATPRPHHPPVIAMALLAAAGLVFMMLGDPAGLMADGTAWGRGLSIAAGAFSGPSGPGSWIAAPGLALVSGILLVLISKRAGLR